MANVEVERRLAVAWIGGGGSYLWAIAHGGFVYLQTPMGVFLMGKGPWGSFLWGFRDKCPWGSHGQVPIGVSFMGKRPNADWGLIYGQIPKGVLFMDKYRRGS